MELLTGAGRQLNRDVAVVRDFAATIIRHRRQIMEQQQEAETRQDNYAPIIGHKLPDTSVDGTSFTAAACDLLSMFLTAKGPDGKALSEDALVDAVVNFIIAGRDTTAQVT